MLHRPNETLMKLTPIADVFDRIKGGAGDDMLVGGTGSDTYPFSDWQASSANEYSWRGVA